MRLLSLAAAGALAATGVTFSDARGRQITLQTEVRRVVAVPVPMASVVIGLDGGPNRLVGIHPSAKQSIKDGLLGTMFPTATQLPDSFLTGNGFNVNVEALLQRQPDAVIQWSFPSEAVALVERAGLRSVTLSNDPADQNVHERNLRIVGALLGRTSRVEQIIGLQRATLRKVRDAVSAVPAGTRPRVLYLRLAEQSFAPAGTPTYQNFWIGLAGGTNVASNMRGNASTVSAEQIVAWNPDVILLGSFDGATPETIAGDRRLAGVAAVRNRRVYKMPHGGYRWDPGSLESHLAWQWVAQLLRGDRLGLDLRRSMRETFALLYRHTITDSEIDRVLQMRLNDGQAGYGIFRAP